MARRVYQGQWHEKDFIGRNSFVGEKGENKITGPYTAQSIPQALGLPIEIAG